MRHATVICLCLVAPIILRPLAVAADAPAPATPDIALSFKPQSLNLQYSQYWQQDGSPSNDNGNFNLSFYVFATGKTKIVGLGAIDISEAITDTGEKLSLQGNERSQDEDDDNERGARKPVGRASFSLSAPTKPCALMRTITGTAEAVISNGRFKWAELKPFKQFAGKRLRIGGIDNAEVTVAHGRNGNLEVRYPQSMAPLIDDIQFVDETGTALDANRSGSNNNGTQVVRYFQVSLPDDGSVAIKLHAGARTVSVPFTITNLPMPGTSGGGDFGATIQAVDHGEPLPALGDEKDLAPLTPADEPPAAVPAKPAAPVLPQPAK